MTLSDLKTWIRYPHQDIFDHYHIMIYRWTDLSPIIVITDKERYIHAIILGQFGSTVDKEIRVGVNPLQFRLPLDQ